MECRNATTAEWLQLAVPSLSKWSGVSASPSSAPGQETKPLIYCIILIYNIDIIQYIDHKMSFTFGDISVCGLKKDNAIKAGTRRVETPRNLPVSAEKEQPNRLSESSEDLADDDDLDAKFIEMGDQTPILRPVE